MNENSAAPPSPADRSWNALAAASPVSALHSACARALTERELFGRAPAPIVLGGRGLEVVRRLGAGGMGVVYEVERDGERLALKVLRDATPEAVVALKREFRALAGLEHEGLVRHAELIVDGGDTAIAMELVDGVDFVAWARAHGGAALVAATVRLGRALCALHDAGIVHRDIKPTNVLVGADGRVVLLDFGIAVASGAHADHAGTAAFVAPERRAGAVAAPSADCFAVGVLVARALAALPESERDPRLSALAAQLTADDPASRPDARALVRALGADVPGGAGAVTLMERDEALGALDRLIADDGPRLALITAPSGFGKSALLDRVGERLLARAPAWVLRGRCEPRERVPNRVLDAVVDALAQRWAALEPDAAAALRVDDLDALVTLFPALARVAAATPAFHGSGGAPAHLRRRAIVALRALLGRAAADRTVLLVIDDAQWADDDGLGLLEELLRAPAAPPVKVVLARRPLGALPATARWVALERRADVALELGPLGADAAAALVAALAPTADAAERRAIVAAAGGDPLLIAALAARAAVGRLDVHAPARALDEVVHASLAGLDEVARHAAALLSVAIVPLDVDVVAELLQVDARTAAAALRALRIARLARAGLGDDATTELAHVRFGEPLRVAVGADGERRWHRALAAVLGRDPAVDPGVLIHHWVAGDERGHAAARAVDAAHEAMDRLAFTRSARFFELALELDPQRPDRRALELGRADALACAGWGGLAAASYTRLAQAEPDLAQRHVLRRRAAEELLYAGHRVEGLRRLDDVVREAGLRRPRNGWSAVARALPRRAWLRLRGLGHIARSVEAVPPAELRAVDAALAAMRGAGWHSMLEVFYWTTRAVGLALGAGEPARLAQALAAESTLRALTGEDSSALAAEAVALATRSGDARALAGVYAILAQASVGAGELRTGRDALVRAVALFDEHGSDSAASPLFARNLLLIVRGGMGETGLRGEIEEAMRDSEERGDLATDATMRNGLAQQWVLAGDLAQARALVDSAMARWRDERWGLADCAAAMRLSEIDVAAGDADAAYRRLTTMWPRLRRSGLLAVPMYRAVTLHLRATAARLSEAAVAPREAERRRRDAARCTRRLLGDRASFPRVLGRQLALSSRAPDDATVDALVAVADALEARGWAWFAEATRLRVGPHLPAAARAALAGRLRAAGVVEPARALAAFAPPLLTVTR